MASFDELTDLDMEPKLKLWWTSTYKAEVDMTLEVGGREKSWEMPFVEVFNLRFRRDAKGIQDAERTLKKGMGRWWRDSHIYRAKSVSLRTKCETVVSQVFSVGLIEV